MTYFSIWCRGRDSNPQPTDSATRGFPPGLDYLTTRGGTVGVSGARGGLIAWAAHPLVSAPSRLPLALRLAWLRITAGLAAAASLNSPDFRPASPREVAFVTNQLHYQLCYPGRGTAKRGHFRSTAFGFSESGAILFNPRPAYNSGQAIGSLVCSWSPPRRSTNKVSSAGSVLGNVSTQ